MAASTARGISAAQRPKKRVMSSSVSAWTMPATGVRPPLLMLVAVRAMAPVAGMPPKSGEAMLATPCATSSMLERWRPPIMPSATTAERSDSIAPSAAMANAGPTSSRSSASETEGSTGLGRLDGISPKRLPMVSTGSVQQLGRRPCPAISATSGAGTRWLMRGQNRSRSRVKAVRPTA